jgi:hypothetical protein
MDIIEISKMSQKESLEHCIKKQDELTFLQRNNIRYYFIDIFKENKYLKVYLFEKIVPKYDYKITSEKLLNQNIIGYNVVYLYKTDKNALLEKNTIFIPKYIFPYKIIKSMIFYFFLEKYEDNDDNNDEMTEYFMNYNNYKYGYI